MGEKEKSEERWGTQRSVMEVRERGWRERRVKRERSVRGEIDKRDMWGSEK